jgi:hypothetical protein
MKNSTLNKRVFFRHVFIDIKLVHASISGKKISSFARPVMGIFDFFLGKLTFAPPVLVFGIIKYFGLKK